MGVEPDQRCRKAAESGVRTTDAARRILRDPPSGSERRTPPLAQKFLLTEIPNVRGVMIVALSSILPVTGLSAPATGT